MLRDKDRHGNWQSAGVDASNLTGELNQLVGKVSCLKALSESYPTLLGDTERPLVYQLAELSRECVQTIGEQEEQPKSDPRMVAAIDELMQRAVWLVDELEQCDPLPLVRGDSHKLRCAVGLALKAVLVADDAWRDILPDRRLAIEFLSERLFDAIPQRVDNKNGATSAIPF